LLFVWLYRLFPSVLNAITIIQPNTVIRWHRMGFRLYWRWKSRSRSGRPQIPAEIRRLIRDMSLANRLWGAPRIHGELLKLAPDYLVRDRDGSYGHAVTRRLAAMGIRDHPTAPRSPWQNGHVERLIGSIRRECLDHIVVFGEAHLRRILSAYGDYYNELRTHLSLDKDSPVHRPIQRLGQVVARPILGGLHHRYCRI
jgi:hypothetical protein